MTIYVDVDHAGDKTTCRIHTLIIIFVKSTPILWNSKHQTIIELSTFGSKIVALRTTVEIVNGMHYKLRMMDVAINGPAYIFGYNMSVVNGASIPQ